MTRRVAGRVYGAALAAATLSALQAQPAPETEVVAFVNARWFVGERFVDGPHYVSAGRFVDRPPRRAVTRTVDLKGRFVVPPFAEAHNHNTSPAQLARYFDQGIFYVKNPNSFPGDRTRAAGLVNTPSSPDVVFANGGLTSPGGHPVTIIDRGIGHGSMTAADGDGAFYHAIGNRADLARRWPAVLAGRPDFVKLYLLYSERHATASSDERARGWRGLDPALVPEVVGRAHAAGLRVSAHVESAADFATAVDGGVDEITHLPGFRGPAPGMPLDPSPFELRGEVVRRAAARGVTVVTTVSGIEEVPATPDTAPLRALARSLYRDSLRRLSTADVPIAIGSDRYEFTARDEARYLSRLGVFEPATLLTMWCRTTAATIFPTRHIGVIEAGAEASFLVLDGNPLEDFSAVTRIVLRVKQGVVTGAP